MLTIELPHEDKNGVDPHDGGATILLKLFELLSSVCCQNDVPCADIEFFARSCNIGI